MKIEPEVKVLLDKFKEKDHMLCFRETMNYKSFGIRLNKNLRKIGNSIGIENLTTYFLRHTWATIAASLDIPKETIAAALGHGGNTVTDIYINFDQKKIIDEANRKVMDFLSITKQKYISISEFTSVH
ncbi:tyrosine-type recombinase/integrase [Dysgonomonas sp. 511]|uniref:tyrosine-type recombinase/integrase n=1 Tax=Dysgonomonas sp. 511 TaxID=2302930 RepID=UPI0034CD8DB8